MRLQELFLIETTEEDRAIISLALAIHTKYRNYEDSDEDNVEVEYDPDIDLNDPIDRPINIGKIGDLFDTPLTLLNNVTIEFQSSDGMYERSKDDDPDDIEKEKIGNRSVILGLWYSDISTIVLNKDYLDLTYMRTIISHELRHALDDYKSGFKAGISDRYRTPKKKEHRTNIRHPYLGKLGYTAQPAEINGRFLQVLDALVPIIKREVKISPDTAKNSIFSKFKAQLEIRRIADLFPEKEKSRDYKRLLKRGIDFIEKELRYVQSSQK